MQPSPDPHADEGVVSFMGRPVPTGMALRFVSIPGHAKLDYEPSQWAQALVVVEAGLIELECVSGARATFGRSSVLFFDGLPLRTIRNISSETALLSAASRCRPGQSVNETPNQ